MKKRGQVTMFIIVGVVIVAFVIIFLFLRKGVELDIPGGSGGVLDVDEYTEKCIRDYTEEAIKMILAQGGVLQPKNYKLFGNKNIEYICYNIGYYEPCIQQHPVLLREIEIQLEQHLVGRMDECLNEMKFEYEERNAEVVFGNEKNVDVNLLEDKIEINYERKITITKDLETRDYDGIEYELQNPLFNLARIALEISSQEAKYCYFEYNGYNIYYPRFKISMSSVSDQTRIYSILDNDSGNEMFVAVRSCAIPSGF